MNETKKYEFLESITGFDNDVLIPINRIQWIKFGTYENGFMIKIKSDNGEWHECFNDDKNKAEIRYKTIKEIIKSSSDNIPEEKLINPLKKKISDLDWDYNAPSVRIVGCLRAENVITVEDVLKHTQYFYRKIPNFGRKSLQYLVEMFESLNLPIREGSFNDDNS